MVDDATLKGAFKRAAEIAQGVPEEFRKDAFNRALDSLLGESAPAPQRRRRKAGRSAGSPAKGPTEATTALGSSRTRRTGGRPGPKQAVLDLKAKGYLSTKRTIAEIRDHLHVSEYSSLWFRGGSVQAKHRVPSLNGRYAIGTSVVER